MQRRIIVVCLVGAWGLAVLWAETARAATFLVPHAGVHARADPEVKDSKDAQDAPTRRWHRVVQVCEHAALAAIRRQSPGDVQQVSLGDEGNPLSLTLADDVLLTGTGQIRQDAFWHDFYFSCEVSPGGEEVLNFSYTLIS
ncbi:TPA: DUF930 domain-containing protein [Serratia liquefaciens]